MPTTQRIIEQRLEQVEEALGFKGLTSEASMNGFALDVSDAYPVNSIFISKSSDTPFDFGTWELLDSGNKLGGTVKTVYVWQRKA